MSNRIPFRYKGFYDIPRSFLCEWNGDILFFDCPFDDSIDKYPDSFQVYILPALDEKELEGSWDSLHAKSLRHLGEIPVRLVAFDSSKRASIDFSPIKKWGSDHAWW